MSVTDSTVTGNDAPGIVGVGVTIIASRNTITRNATNRIQNRSDEFYTFNENLVQGIFGSATVGEMSPLFGL